MSNSINRREVLLRAGAATALTALGTGPARSGVPGVPSSPFDADSTAAEVTAGIDLSGKTILITGVNSGLGLETMRVLAMRGAHLLGAARTQEKADSACQSVAGKTTPVVCELADFQGVVACAKRVKGTRVTSNSVHPGVINTNINRNYSAFMKFVADYIGPFFMKSIAQGAATSCYVVTRPDLASTNGRYFEDCQAVAPSGYMEDDAMAARLWKKSVELTKLCLPASSAQ